MNAVTSLFRPPFAFCLLCVFLVIGPAPDAHAGLLERTCDLVFRKLDSGPRESLTRSIDEFTDGGKSYRGCLIRLSGNADKVNKAQRPEGLFGVPLPYCPDGRLPEDLPRDMFNRDGWCGDKMADGPDGTSFTAIKMNVFCVVEGNWDGGDDADPNYVPSTRYEVVVKCATGATKR
jgi:hypothetical protein